MAEKSESLFVVWAALIGNLLIAITKFVAAFFTGSSAMLSEAIHSLVDTSNEVLLLYGTHRARRPADRSHPFGHGRELYFWSFIVALLIFAIGAGVSGYEGVTHILHPEAIENATANYVVIGLSLVFEGISWVISLRGFNREKGDLGYFEAISKSKDPTNFTVLIEDSVALLGLLIALAGISAAQWLDMPQLDGVASIAIGVLLAGTAAFLARESMNLLIGESAPPELNAAVLAVVAADPAITHANGLVTTQLGPDQVIVMLSADFEDHLTGREIEATVERLESLIRAAHPEITALFIKPQRAAMYEERRAMLDPPVSAKHA
jgi:cation diffusion facilitator family transporter